MPVLLSHRTVAARGSLPLRPERLRRLILTPQKSRRTTATFRSLFFYTPEKISQPKKKEWADKIRTAFGIELVVISREDIIVTLQVPDNAYLCSTHLKIPVPCQPPITGLLQQAHDASAAVAADWAAHPRLSGKPQIALNAVGLDDRGGETREVFATTHLLHLLLQGRRLVLEAPAGRGKTTTLVQLARSQVDGGFQSIPLLVDLPGWVKSRLDILDYIAHVPAFRALGIDASGLARLSQTTPFLFLLNGWNEISELHSQDAADALRALDRTFPAAGIIVATRTHHIVPPLPGSTRVRLLPLTRAQRLTYLEQALGTAQAAELNAKLSGDRVLDDLTRTPFILSEVTTIFRSGRDIPRTKMGLLGAVVALMEQSEEHVSHLQAQPLRSHAQDYLRSLAVDLTARVDVTLGEADARTICRSVSDGLKEAWQIAATPEPAEILSTLCAHHILERLDYPGISFRFEHQQFQEYYCALMLREVLTRAVSSTNPNDLAVFAQTYINERVWEEPLRMIAEEVGAADNDSASPDQINAGKHLVHVALSIDPILAGKLARLCGPSVWKEVHSEVSKRLRSSYAMGNPHYRRCALAAMLATGSDEFADVLIPLLTNADQQVCLATYRAGSDFHPSSLGPGWHKIVAGWTEQTRIEFISELTLHQGRSDIALTFARSDPSPTVRVETMRELAWMGQRREVAELLQALSDADFQQALQQLDVEDIPPPLRSRAVSSYKSALAENTDAKARLQIVLRLAELADANAPTLLKDELTALPPEVAKELSDYSLRPALEIVRRVDPQWVSQWVTDRIIEGSLWPDRWLSMVSGIAESLREQFLQRVSSENLRRGANGGIVSLLLATADPVLGKVVFAKLRDHRRQLETDPHNEDRQAIDAQPRGLFQALPAPIAVEGLSEVLESEPDNGELSIVTEMFSSMGPQHEALRSVLPDHLRQQLRRYLQRAVTTVLALDDFRGESKARLASALGEVGEPDDASDLLTLVRADIERVQKGRAASPQDRRSAIAQGSMMVQSGWYVQALVRLAHAGVESILIDLLQESDYEIDAAWGLRAIAMTQPGKNPVLEGRLGRPARDYRKIRSGPLESSRTFDEDRRRNYASAVAQRIRELRERCRNVEPKTLPYHHRRLKELAKALAALDPQHSADLVLEIAALPASNDGWLRVTLLEELAFGGGTLPAESVLSIADPVLEQLRAHGIYNDNASLLKHLLSVLALVHPPTRGVARIRELLSEFKLGLYDQRDLLMALGQCDTPDALSLLRHLAEQNSGAFHNSAKDWIEAVAASPLPGARSLLLSFIDPDLNDGVGALTVPDYAVDLLAARISDVAQADAAVTERVIQLSAQPLAPQQRLILAKVLAWMNTPQSLLAGLNLVDDKSPQPIPYDLWKAIETFSLKSVPTRAIRNPTRSSRARRPTSRSASSRWQSTTLSAPAPPTTSWRRLRSGVWSTADPILNPDIRPMIRVSPGHRQSLARRRQYAGGTSIHAPRRRQTEASVCASGLRYCVLSSINYKLNRNMQRKVTRAMPNAPSQRKKADAQTSVISLPILSKQGTAGLTPMNFRVSTQFHREFKLYAVQHRMSMVDLLQESFRLMKERRTK